MFDCAERN